MGKSLTRRAGRKISEIHALSAEYNGKGETHARVIMRLMEGHVREIAELHAAEDKHAAVESGDLAVLCFELIAELGADVDEVMEECYGRYINKLEGLLGKKRR